MSESIGCKGKGESLLHFESRIYFYTSQFRQQLKIEHNEANNEIYVYKLN